MFICSLVYATVHTPNTFGDVLILYCHRTARGVLNGLSRMIHTQQLSRIARRLEMPITRVYAKDGKVNWSSRESRADQMT